MTQPARIRHVTVDCRDPYALSRFWSGVLGFVDDPDDPPSPDDSEIGIIDPLARHADLLFIASPDDKVVKNRLHLDIQPLIGRDAMVETLLAAGASFVADHRIADGRGWVVLADPEGNEFCVERSAAERGIVEPAGTEDVDFPTSLRTADELTLLTGMLDWYREAVLRKWSGVTSAGARRSPVRTGTTLAGLLKHLALVEDSWLDGRFAGSDEPEPWASAPPDDPEWEFTSALDDSLDDLEALYRAACERSRRAVAGHLAGDMSAVTERAFSLRFVLLHLIEETARHIGQMDILREYLDGATGE